MARIVTLPYDDSWKALVWARENCPSYITNQATSKSSAGNIILISYYFVTEAAQLLFALTWGGEVEINN